MMKEMSYNVLMIGPPGLAKTIRRCLFNGGCFGVSGRSCGIGFPEDLPAPCATGGDYQGLAHRAGAAPRGNNDDS